MRQGLIVSLINEHSRDANWEHSVEFQLCVTVMALKKTEWKELLRGILNLKSRKLVTFLKSNIKKCLSYYNICVK